MRRDSWRIPMMPWGCLLAASMTLASPLSGADEVLPDNEPAEPVAAEADAVPADQLDALAPATGGRLSGTASTQAGDANPFRAIVARNAFRLREPLPPPPPPTNPPPPPEIPKVDVKLAGLGEISGVRYAYLVVPDAEQPGKFVYPALTDDPARGRVRHGSGLEVREINLRQQTVRLVNGGIEASLNLKDHGVKAAPAAPAAKPGAPVPRPGGAAPVVPPGSTPAAAGAATAANAPAEPIIFSRNPNRASAGNSVVPGQPGGVPALTTSAGGTAGGTVIPARPIRTDVVTTPGAGAAPAEPVISRAQQYEVLIRQQQAAESLGIRLPPIPGMQPPAPEQVPHGE